MLHNAIKGSTVYERNSKIYFLVKCAFFGEGMCRLKNTKKWTEIRCSAGVHPNITKVRQITYGVQAVLHVVYV